MILTMNIIYKDQIDDNDDYKIDYDKVMVCNACGDIFQYNGENLVCRNIKCGAISEQDYENKNC